MLLLILYFKPGAASYFSLEAFGQNYKFESPGAASHSSLEAFGQICHCWPFVTASGSGDMAKARLRMTS